VGLIEKAVKDRWRRGGGNVQGIRGLNVQGISAGIGLRNGGSGFG
jgi:hypothetical protein